MEHYLVFPDANSRAGAYLGVFASEESACHAAQVDQLLVPVSVGLRLAVQLDGDWTPLRITKINPQLANRGSCSVVASLWTAQTPHSGALRTLDLERGLSLDFLFAENEQAQRLEHIVRETGNHAFFAGRLFLKTNSGEVVCLEQGVKVELLDIGAWLVKDLLPGRQRVVLRELEERNFLARSKTLEISLAQLERILLSATSASRFHFAHETPAQRHQGYRRIPTVWAGQMASNTKGILAVLDMIKFRPIAGGLLPAGHPWTTGIMPGTSETIWSRNVVFATPRKNSWAGDKRHAPDADEVILKKVGTFLANMVKKSASTLEHPFGEGGRMPAAINYIHGAVHYNGGILLFNDFEEAMFHLSDPRFVQEMRRFANVEKREMILVFRERIYAPKDYAYFAGMIRCVQPWFSNTNGPVKTTSPEADVDQFLNEGKVMWGNPAPYPVVNPITGNWIADVRAVAAADGDPVALAAICRPAIARGSYFREQYQGSRQQAQRMERLLAIGTARRVNARGSNLFFVDEKKLAKERLLARLENPEYVEVQSGQHWPVIIIGGGPAGLAVSQQLKKRGVRSLILEKGDGVGASWKAMPTNLTLLSRWSLSELLDTPAAIRPTETLVGARRFAKYLCNYAAFHELVVAKGAQVERVEEIAESMLVTLADGRRLSADEVINCTGYFGGLVIPAIPGTSASIIPMLHFGQYRSPAQVAELLGSTDRRVLVVGKGISAGQAIVELTRTGFRVELSVRGPVHFGLSPRRSQLMQRLIPLKEALPFRKKRKTRGHPPMPGGRTRQLIETGKVAVRPQIVNLDANTVFFKDGTSGTYDLVLYCTGFAPQLSHLSNLATQARSGVPALEGMTSAQMPHLHFLGLDGQRTPSSRLLRGIRSDAVALSEQLSRRLKAE